MTEFLASAMTARQDGEYMVVLENLGEFVIDEENDFPDVENLRNLE